VGCSQSNEIWHFTLYMGILVALGTALVGFIPNLVLVSAWFDKKRSTAVGISQMGTRDSFLLTTLIQMAILAFGWRNAFLLLAAATAITIVPLSSLLRRRPQDMDLLPDGRTAIDAQGEPERESESSQGSTGFRYTKG
jgi:MFS family permease